MVAVDQEGTGATRLSSVAESAVECVEFLDRKGYVLNAAPTLLSCGADRYLRVWNVRKRSSIHMCIIPNGIPLILPCLESGMCENNHSSTFVFYSTAFP